MYRKHFGSMLACWECTVINEDIFRIPLAEIFGHIQQEYVTNSLMYMNMRHYGENSSNLLLPTWRFTKCHIPTTISLS